MGPNIRRTINGPDLASGRKWAFIKQGIIGLAHQYLIKFYGPLTGPAFLTYMGLCWAQPRVGVS